MQSAKILVSAILAVGLAVSVSAAPPPGKGGGNGGGNGGGEEVDPLETFDPEIAHRVLGRRGSQTIMLTDRDATFSYEVVQSSEPLVGFDLSSEASRMIAYKIGGSVYLRSWQVAPFELGEPQLLFTTSDNLGNLDFNRNDTKLAWYVGTSGGPETIYIHDIGTGQTTPQPLGGHQVAHIRFSPSDDSMFFTGSADPVSGHDGLYRYTPGTGIATRIVPRVPGNYYDTNFDVTRPSQSGTPLVVMADGGTARFFNFSGHSVPKDFAGSGEKFSFSCDNSALLYLETGIKKGGIAITAFGGAIEVLDIPWDKHSDWMPRTPCN